MSTAGDVDPGMTAQIRAAEAEVARWNEMLSKIDPVSPTAQDDEETAYVGRELAQRRLAELQQVARGGDRLTFDNYLDTEQGNLDRARVFRHSFRILMPLVHDLYALSSHLISPNDLLHSVMFRSLLICHKSFLAAAATIARRHPDDAAPMTRRAIEAASVAFAIKHDPQNLERWIAAEQRLARWDARRKGTRPPDLARQIQYPKHSVLDELRRYIGILSDSFVHFTPEFIGEQTWGKVDHEERVVVGLTFQEEDSEVIDHELLLLCAIHRRILKIFDECAGRAFSGDARWRAQSEEIARRYAAFHFRHPSLPEEDKT